MTETIHIKDKTIAVPGETLAEGMSVLPGAGTYRDGDAIVCSRLGLASVEDKVIKIVPMSGVYTPKLGDHIIGKVTDILLSGWRVETRSPYSAVMNTKDAVTDFIPRGANLAEYFALGDHIVIKIVNITSQHLVDVTMKGPGLMKLQGGRIVEVSAAKVPRIVGRDGSMIQMIKDATGCEIIPGQNGWIWIKGKPQGEILAIEAMRAIEREAHLPGLTERMKAWLTQHAKR